MKAPSFQWYPKDCDTDESVMLMTDEELGFYVRCLNHSWINDGLPANLEQLRETFRKNRPTFSRLWPKVGAKFVEKNGRLVNPKQEAQRAQSEAFTESRRKSAQQRWDAYALHMHPDGVMRTQCSASATATAVEKNPPIVPLAGDVPPKPPKRSRPEIRPETREWFDAFWAQSWRRGGRNEALQAADKHLVTGADREQAMAKMLHDRPGQLAHDPEHRKHLSSWVNSGRWADPIEAEPPQLGLAVVHGISRASPLSRLEQRNMDAIAQFERITQHRHDLRARQKQ